MDKSLTIRDVIKNDDIQINKLYKNYLISKGNIDDQQYWSNQFQQELIRHITAEELILYPVFEKYVEQGNKISDQNQYDHQNTNIEFKSIISTHLKLYPTSSINPPL